MGCWRCWIVVVVDRNVVIWDRMLASLGDGGFGEGCHDVG